MSDGPAASPPASPDRKRRVLEIIETARSKRPRFKDETVTMAHGAGGKATQTLIEGLFVPTFGSDSLAELGDAGIVELALGGGPDPAAPGRGSAGKRPEADAEGKVFRAGAEEAAGNAVRLAMTTDTFVVKPIRFPGGSIGELAVNGTVNDLAVSGARPVALSVALVLEEGLGAGELRQEIEAMAATAEAAAVEIVAGDTKVVERGRCDSMYVCTTGLGRLDERARPSPTAMQPGDRVIVSGTIAEHGTAIMLARGELGLDADVESDTRSLWPAVDALLEAVGDQLRSMRDATRGGVATVLNELARSSGVGVTVSEADIPVTPVVTGAAELLGIDPMYVANEGVLVACVSPDAEAAALEALRGAGFERATTIAEAVPDPPGMVLVETAFGGRRVMDLMAGDPLPRIC